MEMDSFKHKDELDQNNDLQQIMKAQFQEFNPNKGKGLSAIAQEFKGHIDDLQKQIQYKKEYVKKISVRINKLSLKINSEPQKNLIENVIQNPMNSKLSLKILEIKIKNQSELGFKFDSLIYTIQKESQNNSQLKSNDNDFFVSQESQKIGSFNDIFLFDIDQDKKAKANDKSQNRAQFNINKIEDGFYVKIYGNKTKNDTLTSQNDNHKQILINQNKKIFIGLGELPKIFSQEILHHKIRVNILISELDQTIDMSQIDVKSTATSTDPERNIHLKNKNLKLQILLEYQYIFSQDQIEIKNLIKMKQSYEEDIDWLEQIKSDIKRNRQQILELSGGPDGNGPKQIKFQEQKTLLLQQDGDQVEVHDLDNKSKPNFQILNQAFQNPINNLIKQNQISKSDSLNQQQILGIKDSQDKRSQIQSNNTQNNLYKSKLIPRNTLKQLQKFETPKNSTKKIFTENIFCQNFNLNTIKEDNFENTSQIDENQFQNQSFQSSKQSESENDPDYKRIMAKFMANNGSYGVMMSGGLFNKLGSNQVNPNQTLPINSRNHFQSEGRYSLKKGLDAKSNVSVFSRSSILSTMSGGQFFHLLNQQRLGGAKNLIMAIQKEAQDFTDQIKSMATNCQDLLKINNSIEKEEQEQFPNQKIKKKEQQENLNDNKSR